MNVSRRTVLRAGLGLGGLALGVRAWGDRGGSPLVDEAGAPGADASDGPAVSPSARPSDVAPTPGASVEPDPEPSPSASSAPAAEPTPVPASEPATEPTPEAQPSATATEPEPTPTPEPTPEPEPEPTPTPTPEPAPEPEPEPTPTPEPSAAAGVIVVERICREALELRPARDGMAGHTISRLTVHHSAVELGSNTNAPGRLRGHQRYHQDSAGWADIAYHLGVDRNGNVYELRDTRYAGDTFTDYDPAGHFLVLAEGDYNRETPSDVQLEAISQVLAWGAQVFGAPTDTISGHRDHATTSCPGDRLYGALPDIRRRAAQILSAQGVQLEELCGDAGRQRVADIEAGRA